MSASRQKILLWAALLSIPSLLSPEALAQKESCKKCSFAGCLQGTIKQKEALRDAYNELAKKWDRFWVKTEGGSSVQINQIDQRKSYPLARVMNAEILNPQFTQLRKDEGELASRIGPPAGCGYSPNENLEMETNSINCVIDMDKANKAQEATPCKELYENALRHETMHQQACEKRKGKGVYPNIVLLTPAGKAREEAAAYSQEIAELKKMLKELKCGYRASGKVADLSFSGVICDLGKPFTVYGSIINYQFKFSPSSPTAGTFKVSAAGMMVTAMGGGSYLIEGADTDKPRIKTMGGALGRSPVGERWGEGTIYIDLTPLDTGECGQTEK